MTNNADSSFETSRNMNVSDDWLEQQFTDDTIDEFEREHLFNSYWHARLKSARHLSKQDLVAMLRYRRWIHPIGDIIRLACQTDAIAEAELAWLFDELPADSYARRQVEALQILKNPDISNEEKLRTLLDLSTDWAVVRLINTSLVTDVIGWVETVNASHRPKGAKAWILQAINKKMRPNVLKGTDRRIT